MVVVEKLEYKILTKCKLKLDFILTGTKLRGADNMKVLQHVLF